MAADRDEPRQRRYRQIATLLARLWALDRRLTVLLAAGGVLSPLLPLAMVVASGRVVTGVPRVIASGGFDSPAGRGLVRAVVAMAALAVASQLVDGARWRLGDVVGHRLRADQRQRIMAAFAGRKGIGHADDPAVQDAATAADNAWLRGLPEGFVNVAGIRLNGYGAAVLVARHDPLGAAFLVGAWIVGGRWKWKRAVEDAKANVGQIRELRLATATADVASSAQAAKEVRLFGLGEWMGARYAREWHTAMAEVWRLRRGRVVPAVGVFVLLSGAHVFLFSRIVSAATGGRLGIGALAVVVQAALATRGIGGVPYGHQEIEYGFSALPGLARLEGMLATAPDLEGAAPPPAVTGSIRVEGVRYRYPRSEREVLRGVDFDIPAGTSVAIVGDNGAGKSTLVQVLARLRDPTGGRITVDGVDLATIDPTAWQQTVAAVSQSALRLPLSARRNVAGGRDVADDVLDRAAADAGAAAIVEALPAGWDTPLSREFSGGAELSGGEWQRLALARALAALEAGARLLVLDEPTAHLDVRAEADLYDHFLRLTRGRTTVLVSHRFSTVRRADRIVVIDQGRVVEQGSHYELVAAGGRYAAMFLLQASRFAENGEPDQWSEDAAGPGPPDRSRCRPMRWRASGRPDGPRCG